MLALPKVGQRFMKSGSEFEIVTAANDSFCYVSVIGGRRKTIDMYQFLELTDREDFEYVGGNPSNERLFVQYSEKDRAIMLRRFKYIDYVSKHTPSTRSKSKVEKLLKEKSEHDNDAKPSFGDFARWIKIFTESGNNIFSLLPENHKKGNYQKRIPEDVRDVMMSFIDSHYLTTDRYPVTHVYDKVIEHLDIKYKEEKRALTGYMPTIKSLYRMLENDYSDYDIAAARYGKKYADRHFKASGEKQVATRILEVVEADGQIMDVIIVDEFTGEVIGRPYLTAMIDRYSGCILSYEITFVPFSTATVLNTLKSAVNEDNGLPGGKFETLITDNGSDYTSNGLKNCCSNLNIHLEYLPPGTPDGKPYIEGFFNILNKQLIHKLPGTTFSSPNKKGEYKSEECARITLCRLKELLNGYIHRVYHPHTAKGSSSPRLAKWNNSLSENGIIQFDAKNVDLIARTVRKRTIDDGKVTYLGIEWSSPKLREIEVLIESKGNKANVEIYLDEFDLSKVYVLDPTTKDKSLIQADSTYKAYTLNLTLYEHKKLREANKKSRAERKQEERELCIQRAKFWREVESGNSFSKKQVARLKSGESAQKVMSDMANTITDSQDDIANDKLAEAVIAEQFQDNTQSADTSSRHVSEPSSNDDDDDEITFRKSGEI